MVTWEEKGRGKHEKLQKNRLWLMNLNWAKRPDSLPIPLTSPPPVRLFTSLVMYLSERSKKSTCILNTFHNSSSPVNSRAQHIYPVLINQILTTATQKSEAYRSPDSIVQQALIKRFKEINKEIKAPNLQENKHPGDHMYIWKILSSVSAKPSQQSATEGTAGKA